MLPQKNLHTKLNKINCSFIPRTVRLVKSITSTQALSDALDFVGVAKSF